MSHIDDIRKDLEAAGIRVVTCERLENDTGDQIRCRGGEVINVYDSGKIVVQGQNQAAVKTALALGGGPATKKPTPVSRKVFVVYGHDQQARTQPLAIALGKKGCLPGAAAARMTTSDGISTADWDIVHELTVDLVNAGEGPDEEECWHRLFEYLDELEDKYGARPSILATRADFIVGDVPRKLELLSRAYALAGEAGDARNQLHIASSLAELHSEELGDTDASSMWLSRAKDSLEQVGNDVDRREYDRVRNALDRLRLRKGHL